MVILLMILFGFIGSSIIKCTSKRSDGGKDKYFKLRRKQGQGCLKSETEQFYFVRSTPQPIIEHSTTVEQEEEEEEVDELTPLSPGKCSTQTESSLTEIQTAIEKEKTEETEEMYTAIPEKIKAKVSRRMTVPELIHHFENLEI